MTSRRERPSPDRHDALFEVAVATLLCLMLVALTSVAWGSTVTIQPSSADSYIDQNAVNQNNGNNTTMSVQSRRRPAG